MPRDDSSPSSTATTNVSASAVAAPAITAAFHPNACRVLRLKLFRKHAVTASHDLGTYNYECRHFIDKTFLLSLPDGEKLLASAVAPFPACHELVCCGNDRPSPIPVLGMLPAPLPASMLVRTTYATSSAAGAVNARKRKLSVDLARVLVVDALPVPLHVSAKTLMEACEDDVAASDLCCCCAAVAPGAVDEDGARDGGGCGQGGAFCAEAFPRRFRSHEYWSGERGGGGGGGGGSRGAFCAFSREEIIRVENALMAHARGAGDRVYVARCAWCGDDASSSPAGLRRCSGCLTAHYCGGRDCQKNDWDTRHRWGCGAGAGDATPLSSSRRLSI